MENIVKSALAFLGACLTFIFGNFTGILIALVILMTLDYITGVTVALVKHRLSSKIGFRGIARKGLMLSVIAVANMLDVFVLKSPIIRTTVICYYLANESVSILENADKLGVKYPATLKNLLEKLRKEDDEK